MASIKAFAKSMLCARDLRTFSEIFRERREGEEPNPERQFRGGVGDAHLNGDVQLGNFFEAVIQYSLTGNTENGTFTPCDSETWESRVDEVNQAIEECVNYCSFTSLIDLLEAYDLEMYQAVRPHPATLDELEDYWEDFCESFPETFDIGEGEWAREYDVPEYELNLLFQEKAGDADRIILRGRSDLVLRVGPDTTIIEIKATKKVNTEYKYQVMMYGMAVGDASLRICHNGNFQSVEQNSQSRINTLLSNPAGVDFCPSCLLSGCPYRY